MNHAPVDEQLDELRLGLERVQRELDADQVDRRLVVLCFAEERRQSLDRMAAGARGKAVSARCLTSEQSRQAGQTVHSADAPKSALIWSYPAAAKASESHDCSTQSMSP